jgi:filamentous hemagglutinin family protein
MNLIYRLIWNDKIGTFIAVAEIAKSAGKKLSSSVSIITRGQYFALRVLVISLLAVSFNANVYALPQDGNVAAGAASISNGADSMTINQSTANAAINWQSFNIAPGEAVKFVQPNSSSVTLNRVMGADPSSIHGSLSANGQVFLVNPNGILFGQGAQVNVGGLVASTQNITDRNFMAGNYKFTGTSNAAVINRGSINANGGYVAMLGANVSNEGVIAAKLGTVALAAGNATTLDMAGDGLLNVTVDEGAVNALAQNGGLIQADGGHVLMTAQSAGDLLQSAVNNTGVIQAQTIENRAGTIMLMGDMQTGTLNVNGTLDASAPNGSDGGFIETSAAHVNIADNVNITTQSALGKTGNWLIDPVDFNIQAVGGDITGLALTNLLVNNNVTISTVVTGTNTGTTFFAAPGQGNINVNDPIGVGSGALWTAAGNPTTLTLNAVGNVNINRPITSTKGNLVVCCGQDVNVNAAVTTTNGSVLLTAGRDVNVNAAMTTTNGNIELCAGNNVNVAAKITLTNSGSIPSESLGLPLGLTLISGTNGSGLGSVYLPAAGNPLRPTVTKSEAPATDVRIYYNPTSYATPTAYTNNFILTGGVTVKSYMLVFPDGANRLFDGTTTATFTGLKGNPFGVTLAGLGTANFDTADVGTGKTITFSGYTLSGVNADLFALPFSCCGPFVGRTTGSIIAATVPPVVVPPGTIPVPPGTIVDINGVPTAVVISPYAIVPSGSTGGGTFTPYYYNIGSVNSALTTTPFVISALPEVVQAETPPQLTTLAPPVETPEVPYAPPVRPRKQERN